MKIGVWHTEKKVNGRKVTQTSDGGTEKKIGTNEARIEQIKGNLEELKSFMIMITIIVCFEEALDRKMQIRCDKRWRPSMNYGRGFWVEMTSFEWVSMEFDARFHASQGFHLLLAATSA